MSNKPRIAPRPPPSSIAAFVGDTEEPTPQQASTPTREPASRPTRQPAVSRRRTITRADGRELRKQTIYLPADLARRLAIYAAAEGTELSAIVADALERYLPPED